MNTVQMPLIRDRAESRHKALRALGSLATSSASDLSGVAERQGLGTEPRYSLVFHDSRRSNKTRRTLGDERGESDTKGFCGPGSLDQK